MFCRRRKNRSFNNEFGLISFSSFCSWFDLLFNLYDPKKKENLVIVVHMVGTKRQVNDKLAKAIT